MMVWFDTRGLVLTSLPGIGVRPTRIDGRTLGGILNGSSPSVSRLFEDIMLSSWIVFGFTSDEFGLKLNLSFVFKTKEEVLDEWLGSTMVLVALKSMSL